MSEAAVLRTLAGVTDPVTGRDLVSSGRVKAIDHDGDRVRVTLEIPREAGGRFGSIQPAIEAALRTVDGVRTAQVLLTAHTPAPTVGAAPQSGRQGTPRRGQPHTPRRPEGYQGDAQVKAVIAVSSAKGGVGKSTVAAQLAYALARAQLKVGLLDADIHGPSQHLLSGTKGQLAPTTEVEGRRLIVPLEAHGVKVLSIGHLTEDDGPIVWRGPMVQGAITRMLWDAHWGELDLLLIDMPPGTGDAQLGLAQDIKPQHPGMGALVVTTPQDLALQDARKGREMFAKVDIPVLGTIVNMSQFTCPHCGEDTAIFGETDTEAIARLPLSLALREATERGEPWTDAAFDSLAKTVVEMTVMEMIP